RKDARLFSPPDPEAVLRRGRPKWYGTVLPTPECIRQDDSIRSTTQQLVSLLRSQLWGQALGLNLRHFASMCQTQETAFYSHNILPSAVCYAAK
ncbi:MAG: hypothetical protein LBJ14_04265, partial [Desulfarculales bacterium]|nr:hypothetical protein [Desulfarculales bacterium]